MAISSPSDASLQIHLAFGKSSVARPIVGLQQLAAGTLVIKGETLHKASARRRSDLQGTIQVLFQDPAASLSPLITVGALLAEPLKIAKLHTPESWARIAALAESIGLGKQLLSRCPHQLSGGQRNWPSCLKR